MSEVIFGKSRWNGQHCVAGCAIVLPEEGDTTMRENDSELHKEILQELYKIDLPDIDYKLIAEKIMQRVRMYRPVPAPEIEARKNELYLAMVTVEELGGASPEETAVIIALGKRLEYLKLRSGNANVGYGLTDEVERLRAIDTQQSEWIAQLMDEQTRYVSENARLKAKSAAMQKAIDEIQEYVVAHFFDTTVGRKIDDFITEQLKALAE